MFTQGEIYKRKDIHSEFGGNSRSGIVTLSAHPFIFIFSGSSGSQYGYEDGWTKEGKYIYTGFGQVGDMEFKSGNAALRDHILNDERVFLFNYVTKGFVQFETELTLLDTAFFTALDREQNNRRAIQFIFNMKKEPHKTYTIEDSDDFLNDSRHEYIYDIIGPTEQISLSKNRIGQGEFRQKLLKRWRFKCAVTKFNDIRVLVASHIVSWKDSNSLERLDVENGLLLSPTYDALFDKHLISFSDEGEIILSKEIKIDMINKIGVTGKERIKGLSPGNIKYLVRHRQKLK